MCTQNKFAANSPIDKEKLSFGITEAVLCGVDKECGSAVMESAKKLADKRRKEILETKTNVRISGTSYYVSNDGDDGNDGKSPERPWKTLEKVSAAELSEGDGVFFNRGDLFRGRIITKGGVTYSAYGEGEKPKLYGSRKNYANCGFWKKTDKENVYVSAEPFELDVGLIVFDNGAEWGEKMSYGITNYEWRGTEKPFDGELKKDLQFHHNMKDGLVYLYSEKDPDTRGTSCEIGFCEHCISGDGNGVTIDNICMRYVGAHGIGYGHNTTGLTVRNCEFGWIGGSLQPTNGGRIVRYGNAVEIYVGCKDYVVDNCWIYQCYDCGITHQYFGSYPGFVGMENILYTNNLIEYCSYAIEWVNSQPEDKGIMKNVEFSHNLLLHSGEGWGVQRPYRCDSPLKGWQHTNRAENFVIYDNVATAMDEKTHLVVLGCEKEEYVPALAGNIFIGKKGNPFGKYGLKGNEPYVCNEETPSLPGLSDNTFVFM